MKKEIANIITGSRIIFSLPLLFVPLSSAWFYGFYFLCGFTDMIDGAIARKMGAVSEFGANLDTVADFTFMAVCALKLLPTIKLSVWLWIWIAMIAMIKVVNLVMGFACRRKLVAIHTVFNKITGLLLFLLPFSLQLIVPTYSFAVVCTVATIAALGEGYCFIKGIDQSEFKGVIHMKRTFMCSLCHNGILGGVLSLDENSVTYKTNKLTVDKAYRNLVLPLDEIAELTWKWVVFPVATFHMTSGENYKVIIFNKRRFEKYYAEVKQH